MSEDVAVAPPPSYESFIREAFIDPIRTVIVVDDEFPTLEALIDKEMEVAKPTWKSENAERAREIIRFCREDDRKWMVEINDGQFQPASEMDKAVAHLHQSDLLILDYHLDRDNPNDGAWAIDILRHLARNNHFNLVVVYTRGSEDSAGDIERVVREISIGLTQPHPGLIMAEQALAAANSIVDEWEDKVQGIFERLKESVDDAAYLMVRSLCADKENLKKVFDEPELQALRQLLDEVTPAPTSKQRNQVLRWALHHRQQGLNARFAMDGFDGVKYQWGNDGTNWIRTERLFVTVVAKTNAPNEIPEKLAAALEKWNPEPHRLLMSRMRAELDENGVLAEAEILSNRCLQTGWLEEFLAEDASSRTWKIRNTVMRHWESLGDGIQGKVMTFSERLADHLLAAGRLEALARHTPPKLNAKREDIALHMNRYACSKPVEGHHLTTGHVLQIANGTQKSYWLCLSPACDLVPGQKTTGWPGRLKGFVAFMAVELFKDPQMALARASSGNHLFLEIGGDISCFSFTPIPPNKKSKGDEENGAQIADRLGDRATNPKWEQMFADKQGLFDDSRLINLRRIETDAEMNLTVAPDEAQVVAQLRYEYALNLLQRLGANLSRVGLDFIQPS